MPGRAARSGGSPVTAEGAEVAAAPGPGHRDQEAGSLARGQDPAPGPAQAPGPAAAVPREANPGRSLVVGARQEARVDPEARVGAGVGQEAAAEASLAPGLALVLRQGPSPDQGLQRDQTIS